VRRRGKINLPHFPLQRDLVVELDLETFTVTGPDSRFVPGRKDGPDVPLDLDPSEISLFRGQVKGRPGSRVVLALRDGHHTGSIDLDPGAPCYCVSSRGINGQALERDRSSVFEASPLPSFHQTFPSAA